MLKKEATILSFRLSILYFFHKHSRSLFSKVTNSKIILEKNFGFSKSSRHILCCKIYAPREVFFLPKNFTTRATTNQSRLHFPKRKKICVSEYRNMESDARIHSLTQMTRMYSGKRVCEVWKWSNIFGEFLLVRRVRNWLVRGYTGILFSLAEKFHFEGKTRFRYMLDFYAIRYGKCSLFLY